jgi:hypothetical protein
MDINTFEFIPKINLPPRTRYLDFIWTYRRKHRPDGSLKKYKACLCVNGSRQIEGIDYTDSFVPVAHGSTIAMVNTLAAMHKLKGKQVDFTQEFPQTKLKVLNYSHSRNPHCAPARTHGQIQAPREPPN